MPSIQPKVSILLATRNGAEFLGEQLESYRAQSHPNWELLVSDDGSTDATLALIREFAGSLSQRVLIQNGPQTGFWSNFVAAVRNQDIDGDLFAFSDQDDVWLPEKLAKAVKWFANIPDDQPALYFSRTELIDAQGTHLGFSPLFKRPPVFRNALVQNIGGGNTMVFNRAARSVLCATPADLTLVSHDWWAYQIVTGIGGVAHYDPWPSLRYRQHGQNIVGSNIGLRARMIRLTAFFHGRVTMWNDLNLPVLTALRDRLTSGNRLTLDRYAQARQARFPKRLWLLWTSGVYRQSVTESTGLYIGALFGRL